MNAKRIGAIVLLGLFAFSIVYVGCTDEPKPPVSKPGKPTTRQEVSAPEFSGDSAFFFVKKQVDFGPRVPGSSAHKACGDWLTSSLKLYGASVIEQNATVKGFDGNNVGIRNIIASFQPEKKSRILLCAHWDTRPFADKDPNQSLWRKPIDGANDGGSGVGVLMEIARQLSKSPCEAGIDIIFFDTEDFGTSEFQQDEIQEYKNPGYMTSWCLGSQYWAKNKHVANYNPKFGILLDMVGAADAEFNKEMYSLQAASDVVNLVWTTAEKTGAGSYFRDQEVNGVIDDHVMVSQGGIRCIDIIDTRPEVSAMGLGSYKFASYHHTHKDNISLIDKNTLKAVGQTLMQVIYNQ